MSILFKSTLRSVYGIWIELEQSISTLRFSAAILLKRALVRLIIATTCGYFSASLPALLRGEIIITDLKAPFVVTAVVGIVMFLTLIFIDCYLAFLAKYFNIASDDLFFLANLPHGCNTLVAETYPPLLRTIVRIAVFGSYGLCLWSFLVARKDLDFFYLTMAFCGVSLLLLIAWFLREAELVSTEHA